MLRQLTTLSLAFATSLFGVSAQNTDSKTPDSRAPDSQTVIDLDADLAKACEHMRTLSGMSWSTFESQDSAMMRRFRGAIPGQGETEVDGKEADGVIQVSLNYEEDRLILANGRIIASYDEGPWLLRRNTLANGGRLPYIFDSQRFFETVAAIPAGDRRVTRMETGTYRKQAVKIYSVTLSEEIAGSFGLTGAIPNISGGRMIMLGGGGGGESQEMPEATTDLAFYVNAETQEIMRVKAKTYQESKTGNMQIQVQGAGFGDDDEEEEEVKEIGEDGKRLYKKGMPIRAIDKSTSAMEFDVRIKDHGKPFVPSIGATEKKLLKLSRGR